MFTIQCVNDCIKVIDTGVSVVNCLIKYTNCAFFRYHIPSSRGPLFRPWFICKDSIIQHQKDFIEDYIWDFEILRYTGTCVAEGKNPCVFSSALCWFDPSAWHRLGMKMRS